MAENETNETAEDVAAFIERVADENRRADARALCAIVERATGEQARKWGTSIIATPTRRCSSVNRRAAPGFVEAQPRFAEAG